MDERLNEMIGDVEGALQSYFDKRGGENWPMRDLDGTVCARLDGIFSLDEMSAFIIAAITKKKVEDLIGENYEINLPADFVPRR